MTRRARVAGVVAAVAAALVGAWLALARRAPTVSASAGASWTVVELAPGPVLLSPAKRPTWRGDEVVALSSLEGDTLVIEPRPAGETARVALAARGALAPSGAPAVPLAGGWLVPLSRPALPGDAALILARGAEPRLIELPPGERVVAARAGVEPELLLTGAGDGGAAALVRVAVLDDGALVERERATVPYTPTLAPVPVEDQRCGVAGERYSPLLARSPAGGVLVAVTDERMFPLRFPASPTAAVAPVCGPCPPLAISRDGDDVTLLVNVGRKLAKSPLVAPARPVRAASGACVDGRTVVALAAGDAVWVASTPPDGAWRLGEPVRVAGATSDGAPSEVRIVGAGARLDLFLRRPRGATVTRLTSADGGRSWR